MIRWLFFDMGYTLVDETRVWQARCREQAAMAEAREKRVSEADILHAIEQASRDWRPQYRGALAALGLTAAAPYRSELEILYPDAPAVLSRLCRRYSLGVIANQAAGLEQRLSAFGIRQYFSLVVSSWESGVMKPDPGIFRLALEKAGCAPREAVMIGDRLDNDVLPAKALGMKTLWIRQGFGALQSPRGPDCTPDWTAHSLLDLLHIDFSAL